MSLDFQITVHADFLGLMVFFLQLSLLFNRRQFENSNLETAVPVLLYTPAQATERPGILSGSPEPAVPAAGC